MLKVKKKVTMTLLPKDMNYIPGNAPKSWHEQASVVRGGAPNVIGYDSSRDPVDDDVYAARLAEKISHARR